MCSSIFSYSSIFHIMAPADPKNNKHPSSASVSTTCLACAKLDVGVCPSCFEKLKSEEDAEAASVERDKVGESIQKLQEAKSRIRSAPSRSGSGAEPPPLKKPSMEDPAPFSPITNYRKRFFPIPSSSSYFPNKWKKKTDKEDPILVAITALSKKCDNLSTQSDIRNAKCNEKWFRK